MISVVGVARTTAAFAGVLMEGRCVATARLALRAVVKLYFLSRKKRGHNHE